MHSKTAILMIGLCGVYLVGCGGSDGSSALSFEDMCDQGSSVMCEKASGCGSTQPKADCIAQGKAQSCPGGQEQFCGVGLTVQSSKASACLDALGALTCSALDTVPTACTPEVLCTSSSQGGPATNTPQGEACHGGSANECDAKASVCFAAGTSSSCPDKALCVGDSKGMNCAAPCTIDTDCLSASTGLVCMQGCPMSILNSFCVRPSVKTSFLKYSCDGRNASTEGIVGWSL
jgi:hypothetical protein